LWRVFREERQRENSKEEGGLGTGVKLTARVEVYLRGAGGEENGKRAGGRESRRRRERSYLPPSLYLATMTSHGACCTQ
jgi:hypothetical protein